jgi:branched-chain amino acid transport system substrate-binding protein
LGEVQARDPRYPDRQNVQAHARKNLDALAQGVPSRRGLPRWAIPAISSAVLLAGILATIFGGQFISSLISDSITDGDQPAIVSLLEPTEIETPAEPTDTPTDSEAPAEPTDVPTQIDAPAESVALTEGEYECTDPLGCVEIGPGDPVHFAYALTLSGPNEIIGVDSRNGLNIAIDEWGQILGHDIMLTGESDQCPGEGGQVAATKLAADPSIVAVIGTSCSSAARVAVPLLSQAGFVIISPSNTSPELTIAGNENQHPGYARTSHSDAVQSKAAAEFVYNDLGLRKGATIHDGRNYTKELERVFAEEFQALGGEITGQQAVDPNQTDFISVLTNIATGNPEIIFYSTFNTAGSLPRQAQEIPGLENTILIGTDILFSPEFAEGAGDAIEGFLVTSPDFTFFNEAYANDFVPKYEEKYGTTPLSDYHAQAYDAFMIIAVGIESVAAQEADGTINIPRQALRDAIYATKDHQGLTGNLSCSPTGDCADPHIAFFEYHSGEYPPEKIWP